MKDNNEEKNKQFFNQNYFRGDYAQNNITKQNDNNKKINYFTPRVKENETKNKPKILTEHLPGVFTVRQKDNMNILPSSNPKKIFQYNNKEEDGFSNSLQKNFKMNNDDFNNENINEKKIFSNTQKKNNSPNRYSYPDNNPFYIESNNIRTNKTEGNESDDNIIKMKPIRLNDSSLINVNKKVRVKSNYIERNNNKNILKINSINNNKNNNNDEKFSNSKKNFNQTHLNFLPKHNIKIKNNSMEKNLNSTNKTNDNQNNNVINIVTNSYKNTNNNPDLIINLEEGITYKISKNYKYYFHIPSIEIFLLKEINLIGSQGIIQKIKEWKKFNDNNPKYLKIYQYFINNPEGYISIIIEQPFGDNLKDIINNIGFCDNFLIFKLSNKLNDLIKNQKSFVKDNNDVIFCMCDIFFDVYENLKIIPPVIRNDKSNVNLCDCKKFLIEFSKKYNIKLNSYFCLGFLILKLITGNINIPVFDIILNNNVSKKDCLYHTLLNIEKNYLNPKENLLIYNLIKLYPNSLENFLCECLSFNNSLGINPQNTWLNSYDIQQKIKLSMKEIINITKKYDSKNKFKNINYLLKNFEIIYNNIKINEGDKSSIKNKIYFENLCSKKKVYTLISKAYDIEKEEFMTKIINIICGENESNNDNNNNYFSPIRNKSKNIYQSNNKKEYIDINYKNNPNGSYNYY
jgi:hypothetical protein